MSPAARSPSVRRATKKKARTASPAPAPRLQRSQIERFGRIQELLQEGCFPSLKRLSEDLGVDIRTIRRDLKYLREEQGLPILYDATNEGYTYTEKVGSVPLLRLSEQQLFALLIAGQALESYCGTAYYTPLKQAFDKLGAHLSRDLALGIGLAENTLPAVSFRSNTSTQVRPEIFQALSHARVERKVVGLFYRKLGAARAEWRTVEPYQLCCIEGKWYLFGFDLDRGEKRTYVLNRMQAITITERDFQIPQDFTPDEYLKHSLRVFTGDELYTVVLEFDPPVSTLIREGQWHPRQLLEEIPGDRVRLTLKQDNLNEIKSWTLRWGQYVHVIEPPELRESILEVARSIVGRYQD